MPWLKLSVLSMAQLDDLIDDVHYRSMFNTIMCWKNYFLQVLRHMVYHYRYVPAYSTRLKFDSEAWIVLPPNSSDPMGMVDPVWTESNWNAIGLRVYTVQNGAYDNLVLLGGIAITVLAYLAIVITRAFITKSLKRDWQGLNQHKFWSIHVWKCDGKIQDLIHWLTCYSV